MCKHSGETIDFLLLHCNYAYNLRSVVFCLFGVHWVMPKKEVELLECQKGSFGKHRALDVSGHMRPCVMWTISRERNLLILMELSVHLWN